MEALKRKLKTKTGVVTLILILSTIVVGLSYGSFVLTSGKFKASELLISNLNYSIEIIEDGTSGSIITGSRVSVPKGKKAYFNIIVSSVNKIDSKYSLGYKKDNNAVVEYTDKTSWTSDGVIKGYDTNTYKKSIRVVVDNTSETNTSNVTFKVYGSYTHNNVALTEGYTLVSGPYKEIVAVSSNRLVDVVEGNLNCVTSNAGACLYSGGSISNYIQYPEETDKSKNIWRIIGSYNINGQTLAKVIRESISTTSKDNIATNLNSIYNTFDKPENIIESTNLFNCSESGCTTTSYNKIGLISTYEYNLVGGYNSYLESEESYYGLDNNEIKTINKDKIEDTNTSGLRPVMYLKTDVKVTGSGTLEDPYVIQEGSDLNFLAVTLDGEPTDKTYEELKANYFVNNVTCENGTNAIWSYEDNSIKFTNVQLPDSCTIDFKTTATLYERILADHKEVKTRGYFGSTFGTTTATSGVIYKESTWKEEGKEVYFFAGNVSDNWVSFGGYYWRIIRTNEDGSVRLLYTGLASEKGNTTSAYINASQAYNGSYNNAKYVGWMYGSSDARGYDKSAPIKTTVENWYRDNICKADSSGKCATDGYDKYVSKTAIYCNDRATNNTSGTIYYGAYDRLYTNKRPTYKCNQQADENMYSNASVADKFTTPNSKGIGNQKLTYPIALMTADEIRFAGELRGTNAPNTYYYLNTSGGSLTGSKYWWTMSPSHFNGSDAIVLYEYGSDLPSRLVNPSVRNSYAVRPVLSLKSCVQVVSGNGTSDTPYEVSVSDSCAASDN